DHNRPEDPSTARWRNGSAMAELKEHFGQPDHTKADQEERPVVGKPVPNVDVVAKGDHQKDDADQHENQRTGKRARSPARASRPPGPAASVVAGEGGGAGR